MMKITDVKVYEIRSPLKKEEIFGWSQGWATSRSATIVKVYTDEGVVGIGEGGSIESVQRRVKPQVIGQDPFDLAKIWFSRVAYLSAKPNEFCGVDVALWDVMGKSLNLPVYKLLGGLFREKIHVYATGLYRKKVKNLPRMLAREALSYVEEGFDAMKMKVGYGPKIDLENVEAVRDAVGDDIQLMVDANQAYSVHDAIKLGKKFEQYNIYWFEEPTLEDDLNGYIEIKNALDLAIAGGENKTTLAAFREFLSGRAVDIVQPSIHAGGITLCRKISELANVFNIAFCPHFWGTQVSLAAWLHILASLPNQPPALEPILPILEYDQTPNPLREEILIEPIQQRGGYITVPKKPGLGIEINAETLKKYRARWL